ncbi:hypothetical protein BLNAU_23947 [Blattamonas nauphoetae]|uniref:Uncharacterized protein n=1 Tax=Blattamonas nauphoetae TaxID=2049346 RepID=A0ABQ9WSW6_9EUKA|nr:hypothetical protein BLNAU_23947 [Blattamonas nauphoetae]
MTLHTHKSKTAHPNHCTRYKYPRLAPVPASSSSQPTLQDLTRVTTLPPISLQPPPIAAPLHVLITSNALDTLRFEYTHTPYAKILPRLRLHPLVSIDAVASPSPSVTRPSSSTSTRPSRPSSPL